MQGYQDNLFCRPLISVLSQFTFRKRKVECIEQVERRLGHLQKGSARGPVVSDLERFVYVVYGANDELYVRIG